MLENPVEVESLSRLIPERPGSAARQLDSAGLMCKGYGTVLQRHVIGCNHFVCWPEICLMDQTPIRACMQACSRNHRVSLLDRPRQTRFSLPNGIALMNSGDKSHDDHNEASQEKSQITCNYWRGRRSNCIKYLLTRDSEQDVLKSIKSS